MVYCNLHCIRHRFLQASDIRVPMSHVRTVVVSQSNAEHVRFTIALLTKSVIRMGEEESVQCQEGEEDQIRDQVAYEEGCSVSPPFVLQQTRHHWVFQQVITFALHLQQHNRREIATNIDITMIYSYSRHHFNDSEHQLYIDIPCILPSCSGLSRVKSI